MKVKTLFLAFSLLWNSFPVYASRCDDSPSFETYLRQGVLRSSLAFALEYPCMVLGTHCSADNISPLHAVMRIYKEDGIRGFWKGGVYNIPRYALWFPRMYLISALPTTIENQWSIPRKSLLSCVLTGSLTSLTDSLVLAPADRLRVAALTFRKEPPPSFRCSFSYLRFLYEGFYLRSCQSAVGWITFISTENALKNAWPLDPHASEKQHYVRESLIGGAVGIVTLIASAPFIVLSTNMQKEKPISSRSFFQGLREVIRHQGVSPFVYTSKILALTFIPSSIMTLLAKHKTD